MKKEIGRLISDCFKLKMLYIEFFFNLETSWRCTLSDSVLKKKPRVSCKGIYYELTFNLLTYGYACSDWATSIIERQLQNDEIDLRLRQVFIFVSNGLFLIGSYNFLYV